MVRNGDGALCGSGMEDDNLSAEVRIKISDSNEAELAERKEND